VSDENHVFPLFDNQEAANSASYTRSIPVVSYFPGSVSGLGPGSAVTMHGLKVGEVTGVALRYDPDKKAVVAPVHFEVQPERVVGIGKQVFKTEAEGVDAMLKQGLRASLQSANLITGQQVVTLDFVPKAPLATLTMEGNNFVLPTTEGGGLSGLQASAGALLDKVTTIPFDQIGANLNGILLAANNVANGEQMRQSLTELAATIATLKDMVGRVDSGMSPALRQLPEITASLQKTLANTNRLVQSAESGYGDNTKFNRDLARLLVQANETLSSVRALSDLLARSPDALIKGRPTGSLQ
jgi:paraquat-inducible protein B